MQVHEVSIVKWYLYIGPTQDAEVMDGCMSSSHSCADTWGSSNARLSKLDMSASQADAWWQDLAQGKSLADLVKGGWRADEEEVTRIAKELLSILDYLAKRRPAVTHR